MNASIGILMNVLALMALLTHIAEGALQGDYYDLIDETFQTYRKEVRPIINDNNATEVYVIFSLHSIINLDERNQVLSTSVVIQLSWQDEWLLWNPLEYGGITHLRYPQHALWLPDVVVYNSVQSQNQLGYADCPCSITFDGVVDWRPSEILHTTCDLDVTYYPFDRQDCSIILTTWVSRSHDILLKFHDAYYTDISLDRFSPSSTWELESTSLYTHMDELGLTQVQYVFHLKRLSTFYVLNIIIPILLLSLTASAVFFLPAEAGEKIGLSMTVLLAFAVYLTILSENMPQTSLQVSILSVYLSILLAICGLSVFMSVFVLHLHHSPPQQPVGHRTTRIIRKLRKVLCTGHKYRPVGSKDDDSSKDNFGERRNQTMCFIENLETSKADNRGVQLHCKKPNKVAPANTRKNTYTEKTKEITLDEDVTWPVVAETIDRVFFITTSLSIFILTVISMTFLARGNM